MKCSKREIEDFMLTGLYQTFIERLDIYLEETQIEMDDFELKHTGRMYDMLRGGKRVLLEMKSFFPDLLIEKTGDLELEEGESNVN